MKTIYLIHHTHTDVGYTEVQGRIADRQVDFIRQALEYVERDDRFRWTCETFWAVERFLQEADQDERRRFVQAVRQRRIGLSASYLNFSELLDYETHRALVLRARAFGEVHGLPISSAMTADINGHALGYAQALCDEGIGHLFACVHTYHGMYPLFKSQVPFYWQMPDGKQLLVWSGDHYHLGNELGMVPGAFMTHMVNDAVRPDDTSLSIAERRIPRYLEHLEKQGYAFDFIPLMVSGLMTDNAPPSLTLPAFIAEWNRLHGEETRLELTTLDGFFEVLSEADGIPVYEGLWPDWWADLTVATPAAVQVFREGQRQLALCRRLTKEAAGVEVVESALALYAEHTFGHSATYTHPDHLLVAACGYRKVGMAAEAFEAAQRLLDRMLLRKGAAQFQAGRPLRFRVHNVHETPFDGDAALELDGFEWGAVDVSFEPGGPVAVDGLEVIDVASGERVTVQASRIPRGVQARVPVALDPGEERTFEIRKAQTEGGAPFIKVSHLRGIDRALDIRHSGDFVASEHGLETPHVRLTWDDHGISSWIDKHSGRELLDPDRMHHAFTPVYEISPGSPRTPMGRNRKGPNVQRSAGRITRVRGIEKGPRFASVVLDFALPGTKSFELRLRAFRDRTMVEVEAALHKETCRDVEIVYLSLPFNAGKGAELWIDTSVRPMRPWRDQIPGTLTDFFHLYDGWGSGGKGFGVAVAMPDTPLLQLGDLAYKPRILAGMKELEDEIQRPYAWLMNNFWETNAAIDLAGFYRFRYGVFWGRDLESPEAIVRACRHWNQGVVTYRVL